MQTNFFITHCTGQTADRELTGVTQLTSITVPYKPRGNGVKNSQDQRKERLISDTNIHHLTACTHHRSGDSPLTSFLCRLDSTFNSAISKGKDHKFFFIN